MDLATVGPASPGARAQLLLALLICGVFPALYVLTPQSHSHGVAFDTVFDPRDEDAKSGPSPWMEAAPLRKDRRGIVEHSPFRIPAGERHDIGITAAGAFLLDGSPVDALQLRVRIDLVELEGKDWFDLRPDPEARWEAVDIALATLARAHAGRFRFDNRRFADSNGPQPTDWDLAHPPPPPQLCLNVPRYAVC